MSWVSGFLFPWVAVRLLPSFQRTDWRAPQTSAEGGFWGRRGRRCKWPPSVRHPGLWQLTIFVTSTNAPLGWLQISSWFLLASASRSCLQIWLILMVRLIWQLSWVRDGTRSLPWFSNAVKERKIAPAWRPSSFSRTSSGAAPWSMINKHASSGTALVTPGGRACQGAGDVSQGASALSSRSTSSALLATAATSCWMTILLLTLLPWRYHSGGGVGGAETWPPYEALVRIVASFTMELSDTRSVVATR